MSYYRGLHVCSFTQGVYIVHSSTGKRTIHFEDSDQFGPSAIDLRTGDLSMIHERNKWFWDWYGPWRDAGRPVTGQTLSTPIGEIKIARIEKEDEDG